MYYSSGNYEAFARPLKPEGVDHKSAYIVGSGFHSTSFYKIQSVRIYDSSDDKVSGRSWRAVPLRS